MSGIYDYFNRFWAENGKKAFTLSEHGLFHLLLCEANRRHWQMPIVLHTSVITTMLKTTKQNVVKARMGLRDRGIISFRDGINRHIPSKYTLVAMTTHELSQELSQGLSLHNNKDNKTEERLASITTHANDIDLDKLKEIFSNDLDWLRQIAETLDSHRIKSADDVRSHLNTFFSEQTAQGIKRREESECRKHFFFWLKKFIQKNRNNGIQNRLPQERRGSGVATGTVADFEQPFNATNH